MFVSKLVLLALNVVVFPVYMPVRVAQSVGVSAE